MWHGAIMAAAGTDSKALGEQQLSRNGVPIIVDSCVAFVTQYGEQAGKTKSAGASALLQTSASP